MRNSGGMSYLTVETSNDFNGHDGNGSGNIYNELDDATSFIE